MDLNYALPWSNCREITWETKISIFKQIVGGLQHLHGDNIIHRDLCLVNILVSDEFFSNVAICDFGSATYLSRNNISNEELCHNGYHVEDEFVSTKYDIYQLGIIAKKIFFYNFNYSKLPKNIPQWVFDNCLRTKNQELFIKNLNIDDILFDYFGLPRKYIRDLIDSCLSLMSEDRPNCRDILATLR